MLVSIRQTPAPEPAPVITEKPKPKKVNYGMVQFFSAAPKARPATTPVPDPAWYLPRATLIPCSLVLTIDSFSRRARFSTRTNSRNSKLLRPER
jgi:hypothetical protein